MQKYVVIRWGGKKNASHISAVLGPFEGYQAAEKIRRKHASYDIVALTKPR